ncbi:MAG: hypothetical protein MUO53_12670 [Maribacter sp.]|nr:hypothetical protein [Maribacter sp.]
MFTNDRPVAEDLAINILVLSVLLLSVFVVDFIIKRNKMTASNSFAILFYALLIVVFPETLADNNAILCSFFLLLATRRLISIRTLRNIKLKIFDATLWVMASSLFYEWAILYLALIFAAIYIYEPKNIRNWMVPFAGLFTFFMIIQGFLILAHYPEFIREHFNFTIAFDQTDYLDWGISSKLMAYLVITFMTIIFSFLKLGKSGLGKIVTMRLIVLSFIIGIFLKIVASSPNDHPLMVTFFPSAIFLTNYVESIKKPRIKEIVLISLVLLPLLGFIIRIFVK